MACSFHTTPSGHKIAYQQQAGEGPGIVFLCGFRSDMEASKAMALAEWCAGSNIAYTRFDYFAHGKSEGDFIDYTLGKGLADALEILDHVATGPQMLVGSSMGGWIALLAALERKRQVKALIGIAAAPDFTERMYYKDMTPEQRAEIEREGVLWVHSDYYNNDYPLTLNLIKEGNSHLLMNDIIPLEMPIHLLHGQIDDTVPWETALALAEKLMSEEVCVTLVKDGDHRLSRPQDVQLLTDTLGRLYQTIHS